MIAGRDGARPAWARIFGAVFRFGAILGVAALTLEAADPPEKPYRYYGSGYVVASIGSLQEEALPIYVFAGGGDAFLWRGITLGADIGYHRFSPGVAFGLTTLNVGYSFANRNQRGKFEPFANIGLLGAAFTGRGAAAAVALGGGLNYWFRPRVGFRAEVRTTGVDELNMVMIRVGLSFR